MQSSKLELDDDSTHDETSLEDVFDDIRSRRFLHYCAPGDDLNPDASTYYTPH